MGLGYFVQGLVCIIFGKQIILADHSPLTWQKMECCFYSIKDSAGSILNFAWTRMKSFHNGMNTFEDLFNLAKASSNGETIFKVGGPKPVSNFLSPTANMLCGRASNQDFAKVEGLNPKLNRFFQERFQFLMLRKLAQLKHITNSGLEAESHR